MRAFRSVILCWLVAAAVVVQAQQATGTRIADQGARIQVWALPDAAQGATRLAAVAAGKKLNGAETKWEVGGKEARVRLHTAKNEAGETVATVTAFYPAAVAVLAVEIPAKSYGAAQAWIMAFFKGLRYKG
ncbi:MAG: hypothetical protein JXQ29_16920 [Planctomycetes bacterium]|nr:hypothetical protein [Planctomycetota bacterium]